MELSWRFCNELSLLVRRDHLLSALRVEILEVQPLILPLARSLVFCLCCFRFRPASIYFNENSFWREKESCLSFNRLLSIVNGHALLGPLAMEMIGQSIIAKYNFNIDARRLNIEIVTKQAIMQLIAFSKQYV